MRGSKWWTRSLPVVGLLAIAACAGPGSTLPTEFTPVAETLTTTTTTSNPGNQPPDGPMLDMARPDGPAATGYAEAHGVTPEQASEIIRRQAEIAEGLPAVVRMAGDRYVGSRAVHPDENTQQPGEAMFIIYIFEPTDEEIDAAHALGADVVVEEAFADRPTLDALEADAYAEASAENPGMAIEVSIDPVTGEAIVEVAPLGHDD